MDEDFDAAELVVEDGRNLVQKATELSIVDHTGEILSLAELRDVLLNVREPRVMLKYPSVHRRLRQYVSLDERRRVLALLNAVESFAADTLPNYLGCMRLAGIGSAQQSFVLASGKRVPVARLLFWLCDNSIANALDDDAYMESKGAERGLGALSYHLAICNSCRTEDCINAQHYTRRARHRRVSNADLHSGEPCASLAVLRQYAESRDREWSLAERELCRDSYFSSPIESMIATLYLDDESSSDAALPWKARLVSTLDTAAPVDAAK
jgi:hypothetical protein